MTPFRWLTTQLKDPIVRWHLYAIAACVTHWLSTGHLP